jgi:ribosomal protein L11 methyltransferase
LLRESAPYDLVLANILAGPLVELAPAIHRVTSTNAVVVLSGLLAKQERRVLSPYRTLGFVLWRRIRLGDWPTLVLSRGRVSRSDAPGAWRA